MYTVFPEHPYPPPSSYANALNKNVQSVNDDILNLQKFNSEYNRLQQANDHSEENKTQIAETYNNITKLASKIINENAKLLAVNNTLRQEATEPLQMAHKIIAENCGRKAGACQISKDIDGDQYNNTVNMNAEINPLDQPEYDKAIAEASKKHGVMLNAYNRASSDGKNTANYTYSAADMKTRGLDLPAEGDMQAGSTTSIKLSPEITEQLMKVYLRHEKQAAEDVEGIFKKLCQEKYKNFPIKMDVQEPGADKQQRHTTDDHMSPRLV